ncbi:MAG TPA: hypothetical protein VGF83_04925, partial [Actinomycetota bacterium]
MRPAAREAALLAPYHFQRTSGLQRTSNTRERPGASLPSAASMEPRSTARTCFESCSAVSR